MEVYLGNRLVQVNIVRKNNKNIYFRFDEELNLVVSASKRHSEREIEKLIISNEKSLLKMMMKCEKKVERETEFWYLGNKYEVNYDINEDEIIFNDGVITCKDRQVLDKFIKKQTIEIFNYEVEKMKGIIKTPPFSLRIRKMKTRWGVCNYKSKTITLNSELIRYRKNMLRYVIVHEMCHFYHHNHSAAFWKKVSEYYPEYKMARKELRS